MAEDNKEHILAVTRSDQYRTADELFERSRENSVYYTMLLLSALVITSGLLLENSIIVIGGMLITPILTPVLTISLGVTVGELGAVRRPVILVLKSVAILVLVAFILTFLFGAPDHSIAIGNSIREAVLYFVVAVASGVAATFAWARKEIAEVMPGIAIAVSLVPPMALVGIWLSAFDIELVRFYLFVFLLNLFGIIAGSIVVFSSLKFSRIEKKIENFEKAEVAAEAKKEAGLGK